MIRSKHVALTFALLLGCSEKNENVEDAGADITRQAIDVNAQPDVRDQGLECVPMFGVPGERTGLDDGICGPSCGCDRLNARPIESAELDAWSQWTIETPLAPLTEDPYAGPEPPPRSTEVCVAVFDSNDGTYRLETRDDPGDGVVTHAGPCGLCSTLQDLATYIRIPDLTEPVRECGILGINDGEAANLACLEDLGFTAPCAQIWYYNTVNTRDVCLRTCFALLTAPYHEPDGTLNECLLCDEENSGPVFKHVAGRTRRNSGLASAICRPCDSVADIAHAYPNP